MQTQGYFDLRFEAVRDRFAQICETNGQGGAALCVTIGGETVLDLWGGMADSSQEQVWQSDTLVNLFSCTKMFTAVAALQLVGEGRLQLDGPVADVWPEFAANGKARITLRQLLCHTAGLPAIRQPLPQDALYDWRYMVEVLAGQAPWWTPGAQHGYAAITYGWLLGELIARADGRAPGQAIVARTAGTLGLDFHLGLDEQEFSRIAYLTRGKNIPLDETAQRLLRALSDDPASLSARAFNNPPSFMSRGNRPEWRRMVQPAANGHGNARSLAGFYAGLLDGTLLADELVQEMLREQVRGDDLTLLAPTRFGLGCWLEQAEVVGASFCMGPEAFGHPGAGGCLGFADPERELAFGFVTNSLGPYVQMDPRAQALARTVRECLD
ncbi:beta-lactamase family protein [Pseudomonas sp. ABC1]|uniref:serine hydrolase domain-containing protein n=1 Tax=Pseudomonas sp. ABC1 TaxID=2748080 RepID=UPI0015C3B437|nr:serine hydrolase domain-containing protein [Pseudomonas sp. ABC1]QLF94795.1 beta-lactamase family protein [Pseudomonas sp. ABC1]